MKRNPYSTLLILSIFFSIKYIDAQVLINEFSAANYSYNTDNYGEYEDWIELYNTGNSSVNLSGYYLSDKMNNPTKWAIPAGVTIPANGFLLIYASNRDEYAGGNLHTSFKITQTKNSEAVVFADPSGNIIDSHEIAIPNQTNHSWARMSDGDSAWGILLNPTPGASNVGVILPYSAKPQLVPNAGFYSGFVEVSIVNSDPGATIYYTIDGSTPDANSTVYSSPFIIHATSIVKAIAINPDPNIPSSFIDFHTYFIDEVHTIPVVSVSGDELEDLLGGWQIDPWGTFELFDENGARVAGATGEFNKHGNDSWAYPQRGIDWITRDQFGDDHAVKHQVFPEFTNRNEFQRIILKAAANDNYPFENGGAHIRDAYVHTLSQHAGLDMDERTYEPCIIYANGKYWGVYEMREKVDDHDYTGFYYNQGRKWIDFLKTWGGTWQEYGSWDDWYPLRDFILANDMSIPANYDFVSEQYNVLSLIDYVILHSHNVSSDWLNWNTGWWRGRKPTGGAKKWRYILWDEDATFGHYINYTGVPDQSPTADPCNPEVLGDPGGQGHIPIFNALLNNEDFLALYISRYADLNNTYFTCDFMIGLLDSMIARIAPEMPRHIDTWGGSVSEWEDNVQELKDFILTRCTVISEGIVDCYDDEGITGPFELIIDVQPPGAGTVQANTLIGLDYPWVAEYFGGIDFTLTAIPEPGQMFDHWEVANHSFSPNQFSEAITMSLESGDEITAYFNIPCSPPTDFIVDSTMTSLNIDWEGPSNAIGYDFRYRELGASEWESAVLIESVNLIANLDPCTQYEIEIRSACPTDISGYSFLTLQTICGVSTNEPASGNISFALVYPNPFQNKINVELDLQDVDNITIELLDITGRKIQSQFFENILPGFKVLSFNTNQNLSEGIYLIKIISHNGLVTEKLLRGNL